MTRPGPSRSLARDGGGAVMVMGVFMAALMVGFIYYVKGIGDAILFRERMQDAADSAAFAGAAVHARGMNLIALINISSAAVLSVVAATRVISRYVAPVAAAIALVSAPAQRPGIQAVGAAAANHERLARRLSVLRAANTAASAVATAIPLAAEARAMGAASGAFRPPVEDAFPYPAFRPLPVEDGAIEQLPARAAPSAVPLAGIPFRPFSIALGVIQGDPGAVAARAGAEASAALAAFDETTRLFMVPKQLTDSAVLGGDRLQVRVAVVGTFDFGLSERGLEVASWGRTETSDENERDLAALSRVSLAQAEYFYAGPGARDEWLWNQDWRARLRRVRLDEPEPCPGTAAECDALEDLFARQLPGAVVH